MPAFTIVCQDKKDSLALRLETREKHLAHIANANVKVLLAGPHLDEDEKPAGSLIIIDAEDMTAAEKFAAEDPYAKAGLFARVDITPFKIVTGELAPTT